jgi:hypothetical protein
MRSIGPFSNLPRFQSRHSLFNISFHQRYPASTIAWTAERTWVGSAGRWILDEKPLETAHNLPTLDSVQKGASAPRLSKVPWTKRSLRKPDKSRLLPTILEIRGGSFPRRGDAWPHVANCQLRGTYLPAC